MERCPICGGATTCPEGRYEAIRPPKPEESRFIPHDEPIPPGWVVTHVRKRGRYIYKRDGDDGYKLEIVGRAQSDRIYAHYSVAAEWCGQCSYALYVIRKPAPYEKQ